jgi:hypothetical protein
MPDRMRKSARDPLKIGENTVAPLVMQAAKGVTEELAVIHYRNLKRNRTQPYWLPDNFRTFPALMSSRNSESGTRPAEDRVASGADQSLIPVKMLTRFSKADQGHAVLKRRTPSGSWTTVSRFCTSM